jgi:parallel beta helix pectate lyase-like protein
MSIHSIRILASAILAAALASSPGMAGAQLAQTWVSEASGNDANACTLVAPCKTFNGALVKTASGGEIAVMDRGNYEPVVINTKSVVIDGRGTLSTIVAAVMGNAISVTNPPGEKVTVRDLEVVGAGTGFNGVSFNGAGTLVLDRVNIHGFFGSGVAFSPATGLGSLFVTDSAVHANGQGGIQMVPASLGSANGVLTRVRLFDNARGLRVEDGASVTVKDGMASHNSGNGFIATTALGRQRPAIMALEGCVSAYNGAAGIFSGAGASVRISNVHVTGNGTGLLPSGGSILSSGNNTVGGNGTDGAPTATPGQL